MGLATRESAAAPYVVAGVHRGEHGVESPHRDVVQAVVAAAERLVGGGGRGRAELRVVHRRHRDVVRPEEADGVARPSVGEVPRDGVVARLEDPDPCRPVVLRADVPDEVRVDRVVAVHVGVHGRRLRPCNTAPSV